MKRSLAILGSTGSIGTQALEVVSEHVDLFEVYALTANNQVDLLINQARKYMPEVVVIANEQKYPELKEALEDLPIKVWAGSDAIAQVVQSEPIDMVLTAMVGYSGLKPTIAAIKAGSSESGSRAASSHTGAIASSDSAVEALFRKAGIVRCYSREELTTVGCIFTLPELKGKNFAIITHAGGPGVMLTDALSKGGLNVPKLEGPVVDELKSKLFPKPKC